jgi:hypothetical protein
MMVSAFKIDSRPFHVYLLVWFLLFRSVCVYVCMAGTLLSGTKQYLPYTMRKSRNYTNK